MRAVFITVVIFCRLVISANARDHVVLKGLVIAPRFAGSSEGVPMTAVYCFASLAGSDSQAIGFRTWETHPAGWYYLPGCAGNYSVVFSNPAGFMRPIILTNQFVNPGDTVDRKLSPVFDYGDFYESAWDTKAATDYYQTFIARGTSITQVGFKLATDGVDGAGPKGQNVLISIHEKGKGTPDKWKQIGPAAVVLDVDCGGPKNYWWSAGWDSGQVATEPGETYAVHLKAESLGGSFQAFWRPDKDKMSDCYRIGREGEAGWQGRKICMAVGSDSDCMLIPYNKGVQKKFVEFAGFDKLWSQTYVAQGKGLASVILYAATSGVQPSLMRQRVKVRVRQGGAAGKVVGIEKIAIGNGNYTGDASWGVFGVSFAPGEVPLQAGRLYSIEFESIENYKTLHGFVNIKGMVSDDKPGFNPYRKVFPDTYERGTAYRKGTQRQDFDLDMQVIEYEYAAEDWEQAIVGGNLVKNGGMELTEKGIKDANNARLLFWKRFSVDTGTSHQYITDEENKKNHFARVLGGSSTGKTVDGGYVQRIGGLGKLETYRLSGKVRSTWPVDDRHACFVGFDPTGQYVDSKADTIQWTMLPGLHGVFVDYKSGPIRPVSDAISIWLRGRNSLTQDYPYEADFDDFALHRIFTGVPVN